MAPKLTKRELERERLASESATAPAAKTRGDGILEPTAATQKASDLAISLAPGTTNAPPSVANSYHAYHPMDQVLVLC